LGIGNEPHDTTVVDYSLLIGDNLESSEDNTMDDSLKTPMESNVIPKENNYWNSTSVSSIKFASSSAMKSAHSELINQTIAPNTIVHDKVSDNNNVLMVRSTRTHDPQTNGWSKWFDDSEPIIPSREQGRGNIHTHSFGPGRGFLFVMPELLPNAAHEELTKEIEMIGEPLFL
jgi:hypothetical protein